MSLWFGRTTAYQRRTARPVAVLVSVLAVVAIVTWSVVLLNTADGPTGSVCPPPAQASGSAVDRAELDQTPPVSPNTVRIRVLNGGGQRGQANLVASQLGELGFTEAAEPINDPIYPDNNLTCRGNIRFGSTGAAAARTVGLVLPCVTLVRDGRADDSVDVAIGTLFGEVNPGKPARDALEQLAGPGGQDAAGDTPATPSADPDLLVKAAEVPC
ncbi:MAG: envelope integrity protein Cei [Pseudonocardia sp.]